MKKRYIYRLISLMFIVLWGVRYLAVNDGHIASYSNHTRQDYEMCEAFAFDNNQSYYQFTQNGYVMSVQAAKKYTFNEFCDAYNVKEYDFFHSYDAYIEVSVALENRGDPETELNLLGLALRGADWYCFYDDVATTFANEADASMGLVSSLQLPLNAPCCVKIVFGIQKGNFPNSRWNSFENEEIWFIATIQPIEKRIRIHI